MFIRYRWYRIQLPNKDFDLAKLIASRPLTQDADFGFAHIEGALGATISRFLWRTKVIMTIFDDEGTPSYEEIASVNFTDFSIIHIDEVTFLRIENPSRNIRDLLNALESLIGLGFTCAPLTFEKVKPTEVFKRVQASKLVGLKVSGAAIDEDLVARLEFASKKGMNIEGIKLLKGLRYTVTSAVFELVHEGIRGRVSLTSSGLVKVSGALAPRLVYLIERELPNLM